MSLEEWAPIPGYPEYAIERLRRLHANGQTNISALAREFGMSRRHVRGVLAGKSRRRG